MTVTWDFTVGFFIDYLLEEAMKLIRTDNITMGLCEGCKYPAIAKRNSLCLWSYLKQLKAVITVPLSSQQVVQSLLDSDTLHQPFY